MIIEGTTVSVDEDGNPSEKVFVLADGYKKFTRWCASQKIDPQSPMVRLVRGFADFTGQRDIWVKDLGYRGIDVDEVKSIVWANEVTGNFKEVP
jgi:hypothetical protein